LKAAINRRRPYGQRHICHSPCSVHHPSLYRHRRYHRERTWRASTIAASPWRRTGWRTARGRRSRRRSRRLWAAGAGGRGSESVVNPVTFDFRRRASIVTVSDSGTGWTRTAGQQSAKAEGDGETGGPRSDRRLISGPRAGAQSRSHTPVASFFVRRRPFGPREHPAQEPRL
jgi:hypothetical protein